jgi:putative transposase
MLDEFAELKKRYWGQHLGGIGYRAWSSGNITDEMIENYLEHHRDGPNSDQNFIWNSFQCTSSVKIFDDAYSTHK